ncbi:MAG: tetratricopeptide repeat protein [gamma proteobacterium symbiont of Taylorina sp.]|nr:tetratricopeptide repeat protein [gamma proteobacterium symbiont of Taylorina sp.]
MQNFPRKFNPGLNQDDKDLIAQYIVRLPLLKILLETIAENSHSTMCQHRLYYAPRGRGKTMLLARTAAELRVNPNFSNAWIPIRLIEESYYEISTIAEFWLEVMSELCKQLPESLKKNALASLKSLQQNWSHPNLQQMAQAAVIEQLTHINKKAVIMLENMHQLIEETDKDKDGDFSWELRRIMQNEPKIMLLATATTRFNHLDNAKAPFFEIFAVSEIPPLKSKEVVTLWNDITQSNKTETEITPLVILTGGSPRLLTIIAQFGKTNGIRALMENITDLIDEYTEYFKSQLDALAAKERRVFLALADLWKESTAKEISERARMDIRSTSALLGRLEHKGALYVKEKSPRRKTYLIAERLFCIYYKLRREHCQEAVVEALIQFMVDFYTPLEINTIRDSHRDSSKLTYIESMVLDKLTNNYLNKEILPLKINASEIRGTVQIARQDSKALNEKSLTYYHQGDLDKAITGYTHAIERYQDSEQADIMAQVAIAMVNQSATYGQQGNLDKEITGYTHVIERYQDSEQPDIMAIVARAMFNQSFTYGQQGNLDKAITGYTHVIERYQDSEQPEIMAQVARAMVNQSFTYGQQGNLDKAITGYTHVIERYQDSEQAEIMAEVARAMVNQSSSLAIKKQWKQANISYMGVLAYIENKAFPDKEIFLSSSMLGAALTEQAIQMSLKQQSAISHIISEAMLKAAAEERMDLAIGVCAILPNKTALSIIQKNTAHELLKPLIIALQLENKEKVRTSEELLEVADDIKKRLEKIRKNWY